MKFMHTVGIHLDSPLRRLLAYPDAPANRERSCENWTAIQRIVEELVNSVV